jgi:hypothetical protein
MAADSMDYTSFASSERLKKFKVTPFGLVNAGSTYNRVMRKLLDGRQFYFNMVLTLEWKRQLEALENFNNRVKKANLSLKPILG